MGKIAMKLWKKKFRGPNFRGFSFIELMVVVGIVGIMAVIAIPSMIDMVSQFRLNSITRDMVSCFQDARLRAIKENANAVIIADLANDRLTAFLDNGPGGAAGNWALDSSEAVIAILDMPLGIDLYVSTIPFNTLGFNGQGFPATATGSLRIRTAGIRYREISVNGIGSVKVRKSFDGVSWN
ncbi:MAG: prepilin-type N-terminal cleavage/methylation domain-containing protein [Pseudomonadota bacterium]